MNGSGQLVTRSGQQVPGVVSKWPDVVSKWLASAGNGQSVTGSVH